MAGELQKLWNRESLDPIPLSEAHRLLDVDAIVGAIIDDIHQISEPAGHFVLPTVDRKTKTYVFRAKHTMLTHLRPSLHREIAARLSDGRFQARGFQPGTEASGNRIAITPDRWDHLTPDFERSCASSVGVIVVTGITVEPFRAQQKNQSLRQVSDAELDRWFLQWKAKCDSVGVVPTREELESAVNSEFGGRVIRERIRELRARLAPDWPQGRGRRRKKK